MARHKRIFFAESDLNGEPIDYEAAVAGSFRLVPEGEARQVLAEDYRRMVEDGQLLSETESFDALLKQCGALEREANVINARSGR